jgi:transposase
LKKKKKKKKNRNKKKRKPSYIADMRNWQIDKGSVVVGSLDHNLMGAEPRKTTLSEHGSFSKSGISTREV